MKTRFKMSILEFNGFKIRFFKKNYQPLRFGQAFCNEFLTHDDEVDNLFYEQNTQKAIEIIMANYVEV